MSPMEGVLIYVRGGLQLPIADYRQQHFLALTEEQPNNDTVGAAMLVGRQ